MTVVLLLIKCLGALSGNIVNASEKMVHFNAV